MSSSGSKASAIYDFGLQLHPVSTLRNGIAALSDTKFNPDQSAVMEVGTSGLEITVHRTADHITMLQEEDDNPSAFGFICLYAKNMLKFECNNPIRNKISLEEISYVLNAAQNDDIVSIYVEHGSDLMCFQFFTDALDTPAGPPLTVKIGDDDPAYELLPDASYALESDVPLSELNQMITRMLDYDPDSRPDNITMNFNPTTVRTKVGNYELETPKENLEGWLIWPFWESLERATRAANKCSVYLVIDPPNNFMFKFNLGTLGDLVFLKGGEFVFNKELIRTGNYCSLLLSEQTDYFSSLLFG